MNTARALTGIEATEGPSAAQAQLQSATNAANRNALALARSGRGWGASAASLGQAQDQQAANLQEAGNQSAQLRAQENAAWRGRQAANLGTAAQTFGSVGQTYAGLGSENIQAGANTRLAGATGAANLRQGATLEGARLSQEGATNAANLRQQATIEGVQLAQAGNENAAQLGINATTAGAQMRMGTAESAANTRIGATSQAANAEMTGVQTQGNLQQAGGAAVQTGLAGAAGSNVNAYNAYMGGEQAAYGTQVDQAQMQRAGQSDMIQKYAIEKGISVQAAQMDLQRQGALIGGVATVGAALASSDERVKENIEPASDSILSAFLNVEPSAFDYREPEKHGQGRYWGLMAQDLEKTEAGGSVVEEHDGTKMLNLPKLNMLTAAGLGALAKEFYSLKHSIQEDHDG